MSKESTQITGTAEEVMRQHTIEDLSARECEVDYADGNGGDG